MKSIQGRVFTKTVSCGQAAQPSFIPMLHLMAMKVCSSEKHTGQAKINRRFSHILAVRQWYREEDNARTFGQCPILSVLMERWMGRS